MLSALRNYLRRESPKTPGDHSALDASSSRLGTDLEMERKVHHSQLQADAELRVLRQEGTLHKAVAIVDMSS